MIKLLSIQTDTGEIYNVGDTVKWREQIYTIKILGQIFVNLGNNIVARISELQLYIEPNFELPKNWHVVTTPETKKIIFDWHAVWNNRYPEGDILVGMSYNSCTGTYSKGWNRIGEIKSESPVFSYDFGEEITFEQFQKYVLNQ